MHKPRDYSTSDYQKVIAISEKKLAFIDLIRGKKSKAGKLNEIIDFYKIKNGL